MIDRISSRKATSWNPLLRDTVFILLKANSPLDKKLKMYKAKKFIKHPGFSTRTLNNDICLIYTEQEIEFNHAVTPACIPDMITPMPQVTDDEECYVAGWGRLAYNGAVPKKLQELNVKAISHSQERWFYFFKIKNILII